MRRRLFMLAGATIIAGLSLALFLTSDHWMAWFHARDADAKKTERRKITSDEPTFLKMSPQARANLGLVSKQVILSKHSRTIELPGVIVDRPGRSDREVTSPAVGVVTKVAESLKPLMDNKDLKFEMMGQIKQPVQGDETRLRQVFIKLLDNAIKYTPIAGRIAVQLEENGGMAVIRISDTGVGIAPEHQPHVFERFYRVDKARSRAEGGTGLGLSIVRSIVQSHDGDISLTSEPGKGTTFVVAPPIGGPQST